MNERIIYPPSMPISPNWPGLKANVVDLWAQKKPLRTDLFHCVRDTRALLGSI